MPVILLVREQPPRFENVGVYLHPYDENWNLEFDSQRLTTSAINYLDECMNAESPSAAVIAKGVRLASELCAFRHLEFCGRPTNTTFLKHGTKLGIQFFAELENNPDAAKDDYIWGVPTLVYAWTMLAIENEWDPLLEIATKLRASFAPNRCWDPDRSPPKDLAKFWRIVARKLPQSSERIKPKTTLRKSLDDSQCDWGTRLLSVWNSILENDQKSFSRTFVECLSYAVAACDKHQRMRILLPEQNIFYWVCWQESLLLLIAQSRDLVLPQISSPEVDWLLTRESLALNN